MRITFVCPTVNMSGGTKVIVIYAKALTSMGHSVCAVSPPAKRAPMRHRLKSLLTSSRVPKSESVASSHFDDSGVDHRVLDQWRPIVDDDVPDSDVVIATWWETAEWVQALRPGKGAKVYFIQHHEVFPHLPVARCHATYRFPMHKVVIARWLEKVMREQYGDNSVDLVPNAVDPLQFFALPRGKQARPTIGLLYASVAFKGLDLVLQALPIVRRRFPDLRVISFGSERPNAALPLPDYAEFIYCPQQAYIREIYAQCDVWVTASRTEGFNLPAMEAMACRTPVVATRTGWPAEAVIDGRNGVLTEIGDVPGLAKAIEWVLTRDEDDWRLLSTNAYATVASASWKRSAELFEAALTRACHRARRGEILGSCDSQANEGAQSAAAS